LIKKGMADYLIIPAYNKTYYVDQGTIKPLPNKTDKNNINGENNQVVPRYYEDTHLELIEAKKTLKMYGQNYSPVIHFSLSLSDQCIVIFTGLNCYR